MRLNTFWSRCSYTVYEQCMNVNTRTLVDRDADREVARVADDDAESALIMLQ